MQDGIKEEADGSAAEKSEEEARGFRHVVDHARVYDRFDDGNHKRRDSDPNERLTGRQTERPGGRHGETEVSGRTPCTKRKRAIKQPERARRILMANGVDECVPALAIWESHQMLKDGRASGNSYKTSPQCSNEKSNAQMDRTVHREGRHVEAEILNIEQSSETLHDNLHATSVFLQDSNST